MDSMAVVLGRRIRKLREHKGLNQTELARLVLSSKTAISDYELGNRAPDADMVAKLEVALDADGVLTEEHSLLDLGEQDSATVAEAEAGALAMTVWESRAVPGPVQTAAYSRAQLSVSLPPERVEREVRVRAERHKGLDRLVSGWFVLSESVLRLVFGGRDVMRCQLDHLEAVALRPNIAIQVMPFAVTDPPGTDGPLTVIEYVDKPAIWFTEGRETGRLSADRAEVLGKMHELSVIKASALSVPESIAFIRQLKESYEH
jgi:transcriptional regulator with XRE-family HTH domain